MSVQALKAVYVDYRRIKGRKVHQIIFEVPSELWPDVYAILCEPNIETSDWWGIARLNNPSEAREHRGRVLDESTAPVTLTPGPEPAGKWDKWKPDYQHPAKECALLCQKQTFWDFLTLQEFGSRPCENEADAAAYVRNHCGVNTRADFATNPVALRKWRALEASYTRWLEAA